MAVHTEARTSEYERVNESTEDLLTALGTPIALFCPFKMSRKMFTRRLEIVS